ncbi:MAG TPA: hypothetical protein VMU09_11205 [Acidimicrobiales bacterium]|nr:hypothetical protein [Acidimicrobiales bacterium]
MHHRTARLMAALTLVIGGLALGSVALIATAVPASAHTGAISITCDTITVSFDHFPSGHNTATVVINGGDHTASWFGSSGTYSTARPHTAVTVSASWTADGGGSAGPVSNSGSDCPWHQTTTTVHPTTTTEKPGCEPDDHDGDKPDDWCPTTTTKPPTTTVPPTTEPPTTAPPTTEPPCPTTTTAEQVYGLKFAAVECPPPTTVLPPPILTCANVPALCPTTVPPTTEPPTTVAPSTTVAPTSTTTPPVSLIPPVSEVNPTPTTTAPPATELAHTGAPLGLPLAVAGLLISVGTALVRPRWLVALVRALR